MGARRAPPIADAAAPRHRRARLRALSTRRHRAGSRRARPRPRRALRGARRRIAGSNDCEPGRPKRPPAATADSLPRAIAPELPAQRYIVVEGPIGVGKTSLARRLAGSLEAELVLEQDAQNPFLERFYKNPKAGALPAQLFFLFQRAQQLGGLKQQDLFAPRRVADYLFEKDRLFASLTLDPAEMSLYEQVASRLDVDPPKPDLVVYLQAPVDTLLQRIAKAGHRLRERHRRHLSHASQRRLRALFPRVRPRADLDSQRGEHRSGAEPGRLRRAGGAHPQDEEGPHVLQPHAPRYYLTRR
jgi:deoxyadenosine/deoxycytidine kinase